MKKLKQYFVYVDGGCIRDAEVMNVENVPESEDIFDSDQTYWQVRYPTDLVGFTVAADPDEACRIVAEQKGCDYRILCAEMVPDQQAQQDVYLETLWAELSDVAFDENANGRLLLVDRWQHFPAGTDREEIWHWFDTNYSNGVRYLLYGDGVDRTAEIAREYAEKASRPSCPSSLSRIPENRDNFKILERNKQCFECMSEYCVFNPEGICRYPLLTGKMPDYLGEDGCTAFVPTDSKTFQI